MASTIAATVDRATAESLLLPNWDANLAIVDYATGVPARCVVQSTQLASGTTPRPQHSPHPPPRAPRSIQEVFTLLARRLAGSRNPKVAVLALTVADAVIKNAPTHAASALAASPLWAPTAPPAAGAAAATIVELARSEVGDVRNAAREIIALLGTAHAGVEGSPFAAVYARLQAEGVTFPTVSEPDVAPLRPRRGSSGVAPPAHAPAPPPAAAPPIAHASPYGGRAHHMHAAAGAPTPAGPPAAAGGSPASRPASGSGARVPPSPLTGAAAPVARAPSPAPPGGVADDGAAVVAAAEAMAAAFDKVQRDLQSVRAHVAGVARLLVEGSAATPTNAAFLDAVDFLEQVAPRLGELIEAGVAGVIQDETLFDRCLSTNEAVARLLEVCVPIVDAADVTPGGPGGDYTPRAYAQFADLVDFDTAPATPIPGAAAPTPAAAAAAASSPAAAGTLPAPSVPAAAAAAAGATSSRASPAPLPAAAGHDDLMELFSAATAPAPAPAPASPPAAAAMPPARTSTSPAPVRADSFDPFGAGAGAAAAPAATATPGHAAVAFGPERVAYPPVTASSTAAAAAAKPVSSPVLAPAPPAAAAAPPAAALAGFDPFGTSAAAAAAAPAPAAAAPAPARPVDPAAVLDDLDTLLRS